MSILIINKIFKVPFFGSTLLCLIILLTSLIIITCIFHHNDINVNNAYAEREDKNNRKNVIVTIPKGSANPEVDITKLGPRQWYLPRQITIVVNDTVIWTNNDTEVHTVTSGIGAGIESLMNNKRGIPNGIFDSGSIKPGQSWTHIFSRPGTYTYFCTFHPWMEGVVAVQGKAQNIPNYSVDGSGKKISKFPLYTFTPDGKTEVGLSWDPPVLLTGKEISFIVTFFDRANNKQHLLPFDFILMHNGKQLERIPSISQIGMDVQHYVFSTSGPVTIRIENIGGVNSSYTQFNSTVFDNPSISSAAADQLAEQYKSIANSQSSNPFRVSPLTLVYLVYAVIFGIPAATGLVYFLYRKGKI